MFKISKIDAFIVKSIYLLKALFFSSIVSFSIGLTTFLFAPSLTPNLPNEYKNSLYKLDMILVENIGHTHLAAFVVISGFIALIISMKILSNRYIRKADIYDSAVMEAWLLVKAVFNEGFSFSRGLLRSLPGIILFIVVLVLYIPIKIFKSLWVIVTGVSMDELIVQAILNNGEMVTSVGTKYYVAKKFAATHGARMSKFKNDPEDDALLFDYDFQGDVYQISVIKDDFSNGTLVSAKLAPKNSAEALAEIHASIRKHLAE